MGLKERKGRMVTQIVPNIKMPTLRDVVLKNVKPGSIVSTDELMSYSLLTRDGYTHGKINHSAGEYAYPHNKHGVVHHVNHVESFWRIFKKSIASTHIHVSPKYMDRYLREFTFRANHREKQNAMFDLLIGAV